MGLSGGQLVEVDLDTGLSSSADAYGSIIQEIARPANGRDLIVSARTQTRPGSDLYRLVP